ncbi:uncharacterized protein LOC105685357 [Athalia rosae]|uniref:uncharacterized protein LOC105685357 n=1 Tax=Athalia rosae TaxID=37344 RepID=UPI002034202E|nr:uncharacterized protein LOC105685357 [Athalia rosae]
MRVIVGQLMNASVWLIVLNILQVLGHGMVMDPVNRGSMWRKGYPTPINYNDNANYCGGYAKQWMTNDGKCGVCGDDYSSKRPRDNENTGKYGTGIVVASYRRGSQVNVTLLITANHKGYFKFNICDLSGANEKEVETEACFDAYPLSLIDGSDNYKLVSERTGLFQVPLKLPDTLEICDRCVLRWHYTTGNNWGFCTDENGVAQGYGALGCGPQETFRTCSDISIF